MCLIVEDDTFIRMHLCDIAEAAGFAVTEAGSADAAMDLLRNGLRPAVLVTDIDMPGAMDGLDLAREVVARWPSIRIVVVSGRGAELHGLPPGIACLAKPFDERRITQALLH